ncbi:hypothetical protein PV327_010106 [Microctonus hyperodae]|uniref:Ty3 transposon capsid-like protein domain-containing protein n=1 Tax=Microctonus hyperodae TaxID=165561 RepID=A0AA39FRK9_MICHY|nr:hypothetical protein PV327_010106 [Microctonus hyperodae]
MDAEGNMVFHDEYLEEAAPTPITTRANSRGVGTEKCTRSKAEDIILEKFSGKNFKADTWLRLFIQECERMNITIDKYAETLRLFLEKSALDWFHSRMKNSALENDWEIYNNSFSETFSVQSWAEIAYAYDYKFSNGSLLEYALKKRNLLLEADEDMALNTQINMVVLSWPKSIQNKLKRKSLVNIEELMSKRKQIGHVKEPKRENVKVTTAKIPCPFCEKLGYNSRSKKRIVYPLIKLKKKQYKKIISGGENIKEVAGITKSKGTGTFPVEICNDENLQISQKSDINKNENRNNTETEERDFLKVNQMNLEKILVENEQSFAKSKFDIGVSKNYEASIKLMQTKYIAKKPYRTSIQDKIEIETQINGLLKAGLKGVSSSPYAAPVTMVD